MRSLVLLLAVAAALAAPATAGAARLSGRALTGRTPLAPGVRGGCTQGTRAECA